MAKINLSDLVGELKGRGRAPYENPALESEIKELDPAIDGDAFVCELAQGNPDDEDYTNHKAMWRGRAEKIAEKNNIAISVQWTSTGRMIVSLVKPKKAKAKKSR